MVIVFENCEFIQRGKIWGTTSWMFWPFRGLLIHELKSELNKNGGLA